MPESYEIFTWLLRASFCVAVLFFWRMLANGVMFSYEYYCAQYKEDSIKFYGNVIMHLGGYGLALSMITANPLATAFEGLVTSVLLMLILHPKEKKRMPKKRWMRNYNVAVGILFGMMIAKTIGVFSYLTT